jgi:hypothetical protein
VAHRMYSIGCMGSARLHARARFKMSSEIVIQIEYRLSLPHLIVPRRVALSGSTMFMSCKICSHMCDVAEKKPFHFYNHSCCESLILLVAFPLPFPLPHAQHMTTPHFRRRLSTRLIDASTTMPDLRLDGNSKPPEKSYYFRCPWQSFNESVIFSSPFG